MIQYRIFSLLLLAWMSTTVMGGGSEPFKAKLNYHHHHEGLDSTNKKSKCISPNGKSLKFEPCNRAYIWTLHQIRPGAYKIYNDKGKCWMPTKSRTNKKNKKFPVKLTKKDCMNYDKVLFRYEEKGDDNGYFTSDWNEIPTDFVLHALPNAWKAKFPVQFREHDEEDQSAVILWEIMLQ